MRNGKYKIKPKFGRLLGGKGQIQAHTLDREGLPVGSKDKVTAAGMIQIPGNSVGGILRLGTAKVTDNTWRSASGSKYEKYGLIP